MGVGWCLSTRQETSPSRYKMKILFLLTVFVAATHSQIQFGDSSSSSSSSLKASSDSSSQSAVPEGEDGVNTRFFGLFKPKPKPKPVWRPKPQQQSYRPTNSCGRRRRQAVEEKDEASPNTRFFFKPKQKPKPVWVGCTCGKRKRQADEEEGASGNTRFFGLFKPKPKPRPVSRPHCGSCCYSTSSSSSSSSHHHQSSKPVQSNSNNNNNNSGGGCRCSTNHLIFKDEWGKTHGDCQSADNTGRKWCYTTGWNSGCSDLVKSQRYSSNPWSYDACSGGGSIPNSFIRTGN